MLLADLPLPAGYHGTAQTVSQIRRLVQEGRVDPDIRRTAVMVIRGAGVRPRDQQGEAEALFDFVRSHLRFVRDPVGIEQLTTANGLLFDHQDADCDEFVTLLCSLAMSIGIPARLKVVRRGRSGPWRHIYCELQLAGFWTPADPTHPTHPLGWEVDHGDSRVISIDGPFRPDDLGIIGDIVGGVMSVINAKKTQKANEKAIEKAAKAQKEAIEDQAKAQEKALKEQSQATIAQQNAATLNQLEIDRAKAVAELKAKETTVLGIDWSKLPKWAPYAAIGLGALILVKVLK